MEWSPISKPRGSLAREPNLASYDEACRAFTWPTARAMLGGLPGGGLNIAHEALFRHLAGPAAGRVAIRFLAQGQALVERTYRELARLNFFSIDMSINPMSPISPGVIS